MTARIIVKQATPHRVVRVEGHLTAHEVGELEGVLGEDLEHTELELDELRTLDAVAIAMLRGLRKDGVKLVGLPPRLAFDLLDE